MLSHHIFWIAAISVLYQLAIPLLTKLLATPTMTKKS